MATYQTSYSAAPAKGLPGQIANEEASNRISRTVESAAGIAFGQPAFRGSSDHGVVVGATFTGTAVGANGASAPAGATITASPTVSAGAKAGVYNIVCITGGATTTSKWQVEDPDGVTVGIATGNTAFSGGGLAFTITDSGTDPVAGEQFIVTVTFTADGGFVGLAILNPAVPPSAASPDYYPQYFTGAFMTRGQMYVTAGASVNDGDDVYWNPATGRYTKTTTHVRIPYCVFDTTGVNGDIVEISLKNR